MKMKSFYKANFIFYMTIVVIHSVHSHCNESFNAQLCVFDMYCQDKVSLTFTTGTDPNYYFKKGMHVNNDICKSDSVLGDYDYSENYPIHLVYKETNNINNSQLTTYHDRYVPRDAILENEVDYYFFDLFESLDLSNNEYDFIPNFDIMNKLAVLNLSNNALSVAKLSNRLHIPMLIEIDFSHNVVRDIQWESNYKYSILKRINLSYNYLSAVPDEIFNNFHELETLDVSHNYIDTFSPSTFMGANKLLHLNISFNLVSHINSSVFRFNKLKLLDLSSNKIKAIQAYDLENLASLECLDLNSNFISVIENYSFQNMSLLRSLYLNNNKLENVDKEMFTNVTNLVNIDISVNSLVNLPKSLFKNKNIHRFSIKENKLKGSIVKDTFEGLIFVTKLDLSHQHIHSIEDFGFYGLNNLEELLLNDNTIHNLFPKCFKTLQALKRLDLSFNNVENIEFEKDDLFNLSSLSLRNNHLVVVKNETFHGLNSLQFLDLSDNKITIIEINYFKYLQKLINFDISNNPLSGTIQRSTFDGLNSLESLDISCTLHAAVRNDSFYGMIQLINLNVSHSKIYSLDYNLFAHTGAIKTIDLSFNELKEFHINSTELSRLETLYLNNNAIKTLDSASFQSLFLLATLTLSFNTIQIINENTLKNKKYLRSLDVSFNSDFNFTLSLLNETKNLNVLNLSGIKTAISFGNIKDIALSQLVISSSNVPDVKTLQINELRHLDTLSLRYNDITKLETGSFSNVCSLKILDLSHNKITYIQPGVFIDNNNISSLNISHNLLTVISYGIFRGLTDLHTLDISFNNIKDLQNERFYELKSLSILIADNNKIESITAEEFSGTKLTQLSIGGNPIPCDVLVKLNRSVDFQITTNILDENQNENVFGVTCNKKLHDFDIIKNVSSFTDDDAKVLFNIRDILEDSFNGHQVPTLPERIDEKYLASITDQIQTSSSHLSKNITKFFNSTMQLMTKKNETYVLLDKILTLLADTEDPPVQVSKDNTTYENVVSYISRVKQDLEKAMKLGKSSILDQVDTKLSELNSNATNITPAREKPLHEKISASVNSDKSIFTETCVALILVILICFVLFKVYKSGIFVRRRSLSLNTRELN